jgi:hypothetical protein
MARAHGMALRRSRASRGWVAAGRAAAGRTPQPGGEIQITRSPEGPTLAADPAAGFSSALGDALWFEVGIYLLSAAAMMLLPKGESTAQAQARQAPMGEPVTEAGP